eukprot:5532873-Pyramimonas_sp.AAC.1
MVVRVLRSRPEGGGASSVLGRTRSAWSSPNHGAPLGGAPPLGPLAGGAVPAGAASASLVLEGGG